MAHTSSSSSSSNDVCIVGYVDIPAHKHAQTCAYNRELFTVLSYGTVTDRNLRRYARTPTGKFGGKLAGFTAPQLGSLAIQGRCLEP